MALISVSVAAAAVAVAGGGGGGRQRRGEPAAIQPAIGTVIVIYSGRPGRRAGRCGARGTGP